MPDDDLVLQVVDLSILVAVLLKRFSLTDYLRWNEPRARAQRPGQIYGLALNTTRLEKPTFEAGSSPKIKCFKSIKL